MSLYALSKQPNSRVYRVGVGAAIAAQVESMIADQRPSLLPDDVEEIPFDGRYVAGNSEVCVIAPFDGASELLEGVKEPLNLPQLTKENMPFITGFAAHLEGADHELLLQAFDSRQVLAPKGIGLIFGQNVLEQFKEVGFVVRDSIDGQLEIESRALKFHSLTPMRRLFEMDECYREATQGDLITFAGMAELSIDVEALLEMSDTWIRRKVALVMDTGMLTAKSAAELVKDAALINVQLTLGTKDGKPCLALPSDKKQLKNALRFLDDDFWRSASTGRQYAATSKRILTPVAAAAIHDAA